MKLSRFDYVRAESLQQATSMLGHDPDGSKLIAGGQSLIPVLRLRLSSVDRLIDIAALSELAGVRARDGALRVGAVTRQAALQYDPLVRSHLPLLADAVPLIAHAAVRNRGTIGGSLAHADRSAELPAVAVALDASVEAVSVRGSRTIAADDLFVSDFTTRLADDEVLASVDFSVPKMEEAGDILEVSRRPGDFALAGVVVRVGGGAQHCALARFVAFAVGARPIRIGAVEEALVGTSLSDEEIDAATAHIPGALAPLSDMHASADYRREAATVLGRRALRRARDRLRAEGVQEARA